MVIDGAEVLVDEAGESGEREPSGSNDTFDPSRSLEGTLVCEPGRAACKLMRFVISTYVMFCID